MADSMNNLSFGSQITGGKAPFKEVQERKSSEQVVAKEVAQFAIENGLVAAQKRFMLSEASVVKLCIQRAKRDALDLTKLLSIDRQREIKEFIFEAHTTSIKKLLLLAESQFSEGELRLERAIIQREGEDSWEY